MASSADSIWSSRKRLFEEESQAAISAASGVTPLGAQTALPTLSTVRMREALAAAGVDGVLPANLNPQLGMQPVMCKYFLRSGCSKGSACPFSHEVSSQDAVPLEQKLRTPCRFFELTGSCMRGSACKFVHGTSEMEVIQQMMKASSKRPKHDASEVAPKETKAEDQALVKGLSALQGFASFDDFDVNSSTAVEATVDTVRVSGKQEETSAVDSMDSEFAAFMAEVGDTPSEEDDSNKKVQLQPSLLQNRFSSTAKPGSSLSELVRKAASEAEAQAEGASFNAKQGLHESRPSDNILRSSSSGLLKKLLGSRDADSSGSSSSTWQAGGQYSSASWQYGREGDMTSIFSDRAAGAMSDIKGGHGSDVWHADVESSTASLVSHIKGGGKKGYGKNLWQTDENDTASPRVGKDTRAKGKGKKAGCGTASWLMEEGSSMSSVFSGKAAGAKGKSNKCDYGTDFWQTGGDGDAASMFTEKGEVQSQSSKGACRSASWQTDDNSGMTSVFSGKGQISSVGLKGAYDSDMRQSDVDGGMASIFSSKVRVKGEGKKGEHGGDPWQADGSGVTSVFSGRAAGGWKGGGGKGESGSWDERSSWYSSGKGGKTGGKRRKGDGTGGLWDEGWGWHD
eukprot:TRINITY_DN13629_c3_g1_i1.p1 TRINITY_DN13629_c3_g1~~TRINITY_DN13629_c3_g1_i1.p1  ORF type:complete len:624 (+),score=175.30 TRINITY_DN13629_c3_g1_i1:137-2008(+)